MKYQTIKPHVQQLMPDQGQTVEWDVRLHLDEILWKDLGAAMMHVKESIYELYRF